LTFIPLERILARMSIKSQRLAVLALALAVAGVILIGFGGLFVVALPFDWSEIS